jgi:hypothetical protein
VLRAHAVAWSTERRRHLCCQTCLRARRLAQAGAGVVTGAALVPH